MSIARQILEQADALPEGAPLLSKALLHLGGRAAVDQALARLAREGGLLRVGRGIYVRPVESRFGGRAPSTARMVDGLASSRGETIVHHGAATANALGLTTQVPMREIYLTSGRSRCLQLGAQTVDIRHAPGWQLLFPGRLAGDLLRALAWLGPEHAAEAMLRLRAKLPRSELEAIRSVRGCLPAWMAREISHLDSEQML